jgi:hypothetical protein
MNNMKKYDLSIIIILCIAAIARYWGIWFGLPSMACRPDECHIVVRAITFFQGDLNPHWFFYPSLFIYITYCFYIIFFILGLITKQFTTISDLLSLYHNDPTIFVLIARCISAFLGLATVFIVYKIAMRLFNRKTALIASLFLGLAYLHVRDSHFGVTDIPATFFIMCSILFILKAYDDNLIKNYIIAGIFAGLAMSIKYVGFMLIFPMFLVNFFNNYDKDHKLYILFHKKFLSFGIILLIIFFLGTPYALIDYSTFVSDVSLQWQIINYGSGNFLGRGWWYHFKFSLFYGLGWSLFIVSLAGIFLFLITNTKKAIILLLFPFIYYTIGFKGYAVHLRYAIPLFPFFCITGAIFTVFIAEILEHNIKSSFKKYLPYALAILLIAPSTYTIMQFDTLISKRDNRLIAIEWINNNLRENNSIVQIGAKYSKIELSNKFYEWTYEDKSVVFEYRKERKYGLPRYIIVQQYPVKIWEKISDEMENILIKYYKNIKSLHVIDVKNKSNLFDQVDAFCIPFVGFNSIVRPGPNIDIFELK